MARVRGWRLHPLGVALVLAVLPAFAQEPAPSPPQPAAPAPAPPPVAMPMAPPATPVAPPPSPAAGASPTQAGATQSDAELVVALTRTILVAVHQANVTGNYTVLRDLGTRDFQDRNSAADLAIIFAGIRQQNIDLGAAVLLNPQFTRAQLNDQNLLQLAGAVSTRPLAINFELIFQAVNGVWRTYAISISPVGTATTLLPPVAGNRPAAAPRRAEQPRPARPPARNSQAARPSLNASE